MSRINPSTIMKALKIAEIMPWCYPAARAVQPGAGMYLAVRVAAKRNSAVAIAAAR